MAFQEGKCHKESRVGTKQYDGGRKKQLTLVVVRTGETRNSFSVTSNLCIPDHPRGLVVRAPDY